MLCVGVFLAAKRERGLLRGVDSSLHLLLDSRRFVYGWTKGFFKNPNIIHPLNNSVALEKHKTPELTCKTVGHIQDLLLPGAQQHSNHSLLISHFPYSERKSDCHSLPQTGRREKGRPARVGGDTTGMEEWGVVIVLSLLCLQPQKGVPLPSEPKPVPRDGPMSLTGDSTPNRLRTASSDRPQCHSPRARPPPPI